jgi:hypothetical protein
MPARQTFRPVVDRLTTDERNHLPGWLLALLRSDNLFDVEYAAGYCSTRYYIRLLSEHADYLRRAS